MNKVTVVGSISTDFVVTTLFRPKVGETVAGEQFNTSFGGKGANQAVAAARLGAQVNMIGAVGTDVFGDKLIENLIKNNINVGNVERVTGIESGSAHITISNNDNSIVYIAGANDELSSDAIEKAMDVIRNSDIILVQNETSKEIVEKVINIAYELKIPLIYNPAPARAVDQEMLEKVTYITPNESEFKMLFPGLTLEEGVKKYSNKLIITLGSRGVVFNNSNETVHVPACQVKPIDTTGAGDTFNGALAYALANKMSLEDSLKFSNLAAALSIQKFGAQGGMPTLEEMKGNHNYEVKWNIE
ncbi:ribokinase [Bacillus sp. FJAT-50079]|uniref:ribokinase n=1 Tax=Bacillus sp. FJAT-50079 TaxID=2833577 RepID=UPI001BC9E7DD|nr:ribokinase [Bacillus sp. FJAT-50079]MBS4208155.1 ribokinase [Bacillus sp. FJAT-50079]